ncbi:hypothetical protein PR048_003582 [Dryococelus australis]|uniref:Uncharacterized protein n=1 Tax=Dryococelus australis TaxID=614101 RepID=A0ABQ9IP25_9NEOP|nr:hypothetical protein PR048_003582 [Dryococelus australis]
MVMSRRRYLTAQYPGAMISKPVPITTMEKQDLGPSLISKVPETEGIFNREQNLWPCLNSPVSQRPNEWSPPYIEDVLYIWLALNSPSDGCEMVHQWAMLGPFVFTTSGPVMGRVWLVIDATSVPAMVPVQCYGGNAARHAHRSDEALEVRVSVARIAPSLLDLGRAVRSSARNETEGGGEGERTGYPRANAPTSGIVRHDSSNMLKSGSDPYREPNPARLARCSWSYLAWTAPRGQCPLGCFFIPDEGPSPAGHDVLAPGLPEDIRPGPGETIESALPLACRPALKASSTTAEVIYSLLLRPAGNRFWGVGRRNGCPLSDKGRRFVSHAREARVVWFTAAPGLTLDTLSGIRPVKLGAAVAERLACSYPTKANWAQSPAGSADFFACGNPAKRCRWSTVFLGEIPFPPALSFGRLSIFTSNTLIAFQDLAVNPNLFTHSPNKFGINRGKVLVNSKRNTGSGVFCHRAADQEDVEMGMSGRQPPPRISLRQHEQPCLLNHIGCLFANHYGWCVCVGSHMNWHYRRIDNS